MPTFKKKQRKIQKQTLFIWLTNTYIYTCFFQKEFKSKILEESEAYPNCTKLKIEPRSCDVLSLGAVDRTEENISKIFEILGNKGYPKRMIRQILTKFQEKRENPVRDTVSSQRLSSLLFYRSKVYIYKGFSEQLWVK